MQITLFWACYHPYITKDAIYSTLKHPEFQLWMPMPDTLFFISSWWQLGGDNELSCSSSDSVAIHLCCGLSHFQNFIVCVRHKLNGQLMGMLSFYPRAALWAHIKKTIGFCRQLIALDKKQPDTWLQSISYIVKAHDLILQQNQVLLY